MSTSRVPWPPIASLVITSGDTVQAALSRPSLANRFKRWPGIHDCAAPSVRPNP
jgi:hypothetical protein